MYEYKSEVRNLPNKKRASRRKTIKGSIGANCCYNFSPKVRLDPSRKQFLNSVAYKQSVDQQVIAFV